MCPFEYSPEHFSPCFEDYYHPTLHNAFERNSKISHTERIMYFRLRNLHFFHCEISLFIVLTSPDAPDPTRGFHLVNVIIRYRYEEYLSV